FNPDEILPQAADLLLDLPRRSLPHRDTTNEGPDPDTDPQHTEPTTQEVARQGAQGNADDEGERHRVSLRHAGCIGPQGHTGGSRRRGAMVPHAVSFPPTVPRPRRPASSSQVYAITVLPG